MLKEIGGGLIESLQTDVAAEGRRKEQQDPRLKGKYASAVLFVEDRPDNINSTFTPG